MKTGNKMSKFYQIIPFKVQSPWNGFSAFPMVDLPSFQNISRWKWKIINLIIILHIRSFMFSFKSDFNYIEKEAERNNGLKKNKFTNIFYVYVSCPDQRDLGEWFVAMEIFGYAITIFWARCKFKSNVQDIISDCSLMKKAFMLFSYFLSNSFLIILYKKS